MFYGLFAPKKEKKVWQKLGDIKFCCTFALPFRKPRLPRRRKVHKKFLVVEDMEGRSSLSFSGGIAAGAERRRGDGGRESSLT